MKRCVSVKMTNLKGGSREERDSSPDIFIQVKSGFSGLEGIGKTGVCRGEERPWACVCGIYILTLIVFYCADASPSFPPLLCCPESLQLYLSGPQTGSISTSSGCRASPQLPVLWGMRTWVGV